jgi:hypothetical protein
MKEPGLSYSFRPFLPIQGPPPLDDVEERRFLILPRLELRPLGRPVRSQSLYRLRYRGNNNNNNNNDKSIQFFIIIYVPSQQLQGQ